MTKDEPLTCIHFSQLQEHHPPAQFEWLITMLTNTPKSEPYPNLNWNSCHITMGRQYRRSWPTYSRGQLGGTDASRHESKMKAISFLSHGSCSTRCWHTKKETSAQTPQPFFGWSLFNSHMISVKRWQVVYGIGWRQVSHRAISQLRQSGNFIISLSFITGVKHSLIIGYWWNDRLGYAKCRLKSYLDRPCPYPIDPSEDAWEWRIVLIAICSCNSTGNSVGIT